MATHRKQYDEARELGRYIRDHHSSLFTNFENDVIYAGIARIKLKDRPDTIGRDLRKLDDKPICNALRNGLDDFQYKAALRVMKANAGTLKLNRCSQCNAIVATPLAQQCLWCGFDWHHRKQT